MMSLAMQRHALSTLFRTAILAGAIFASVPAQAIGLIEAYEAALMNDPAYQAARYENVAGQQNRAIGRSSLLPNIGISYSQSKVEGEREYLKLPKSKYNPEDLDYTSKSGVFSIRQPIFSLDAIARYRQGSAQSDYSDAVFVSQSQELIVRVASAFIEVRYAEDQLALSQAQRDAYAEQMRMNKRLFEAGEGTRTDMLETHAKAELAEAQVLESQDNVTTARHTLAGIIGKDLGALDAMRSEFAVQPVKDGLEAWKQRALEKNAELESLRHAVEVANQEVHKSRAGHFPKVDLVASYGDSQSETVTTADQSTKTRSVGLQLNVPIFSGGYVDAVTTQAIAKRDKARAELQAKTNQVLVDVNKHYSLMLSSASKIRALEKAVDSAQMLIVATRKSIEGGVRINLDLLTAEQQLYTAKKDLALARYNHLLSYLKLRQAAGTLDHDDMKTVAAYFVKN